MRCFNDAEPLADEGFYQTIDTLAARRQFNMSAGLVAVLALVAVVIGATAGFGPLSSLAKGSAVVHVSGAHAQSTQFIQALDQRAGLHFD